MLGALFVNEWRSLLRDGRGLTILLTGLVLALVATWASSRTDLEERAGRALAEESAREAWMEREVDHPHRRAHYGDFVFRPSGPLSGLDPGLQAVTGRAVFTEAHRQNADVHRPQEEASALLRFERLEPSVVLQLLVPLVLILAGFGTVSSERESGRLRLLALQGVKPWTLLLAKTLTLWSVGAALCVLVVAVHHLLAPAAEPSRAMLFLLLNLASCWIVAALVTAASSWVRQTGAAAGLLLFLWGCGAIVLPRVAAMAAEALEPLPSRDAFQTAMQEDREQGLDGHNPHDERRQALEQQLLDEHGVETAEELPFHIGGVLMQADEDYGNLVWDRHFGQLEQRFEQQYAIAGAFSFLNPLQATDRLSMAVAGTGLAGHLGFLHEVEGYRRRLVKTLNDEHAYGGSLTGERGWKPEAEFYTSFEFFQPTTPALAETLRARWTDLCALAAWLLASTGLLLLGARRLSRGGML